MIKNIFIKTFGCQMNFNDSKKILDILIKKNFKKVLNLKEANIIIVNSCSIRKKAEKKIYNFLLKLKLKFKIYPLIILCGCLAPVFSKYLTFKLNLIDIIIGPRNIYKILYFINMYYYNNCKQIIINFINSKLYNKYLEKNFLLNNFYITITEGCNKYCSYCIVPYSRGKEISKYLYLIVKNIFLLNKNYNNIFLLGQNVNSYNSKLTEKSKKLINFVTLIKYLCEFLNIKNINFITAHPQDFNLNLIKTYKNNKKLSNLIHLPVQSCSNNILKQMNRGYDLKYYKNIIYLLKIFNLNINISTDIIIAFPNEKFKDFNKSIIFIEKFLFDKSYIFIYSPRPFTKSYFLINNININIKKKRFFITKNKIKNNIFYINKMILNKKDIISIQSFCLEGLYLFWGVNSNNRFVKINFFFSLNFIIGKFIKIIILKKLYENFFGKIIF